MACIILLERDDHVHLARHRGSLTTLCGGRLLTQTYTIPGKGTPEADALMSSRINWCVGCIDIMDDIERFGEEECCEPGESAAGGIS